jgi:hypothetical protein
MFLKAQVPELIGDEVELFKGEPLVRLLLLWFITDVEGDSHLKHKISLNVKGPTWRANCQIILLW